MVRYQFQNKTVYKCLPSVRKGLNYVFPPFVFNRNYPLTMQIPAPLEWLEENRVRSVQYTSDVQYCEGKNNKKTMFLPIVGLNRIQETWANSWMQVCPVYKQHCLQLDESFQQHLEIVVRASFQSVGFH